MRTVGLQLRDASHPNVRPWGVTLSEITYCRSLNKYGDYGLMFEKWL